MIWVSHYLGNPHPPTQKKKRGLGVVGGGGEGDLKSD